ncbi:hypothetical protein LTR70_010824, partial [Exophiala xenobiotica]
AIDDPLTNSQLAVLTLLNQYYSEFATAATEAQSQQIESLQNQLRELGDDEEAHWEQGQGDDADEDLGEVEIKTEDGTLFLQDEIKDAVADARDQSFGDVLDASHEKLLGGATKRR